MIGGKLFGLLPGFGYARRLFSIAGVNLLRGALCGGLHFTTQGETEAGRKRFIEADHSATIPIDHTTKLPAT
jgi:hypothetical protein